MNARNDRELTFRYWAAGAVLLISLLVPAGIAGWSIHAAFAGKMLGRPSHEYSIYQGLIQNGELWFGCYRYSPDELTFEHRIKRLDLATGRITPTHLVLKNEHGFVWSMNDDLLVIGQTAIYRMVDQTLVKLANPPARSQSFHTFPFLYEDRLTMIAEEGEGYRLMHLNDGKWQPGRKIALPGLDCSWHHDPEHDTTQLLTASDQKANAVPGRSLVVITVVHHQGQFHLFQSNYDSFAAYRNGFEFVDESDDVANALAPENSPAKVSGWEPIQHDISHQQWIWMARTSQGLLFLADRTPERIVRRNLDGTWETLTHLNATTGNLVLMSDSTDGRVYAIHENQKWSSAEIDRLEGSELVPTGIHLRGVRPQYLARWKLLISGLLLAWISHIAIVLLGGFLATRSNRSFEFGNQQVTLGSITRRSLATLIDLAILFLILLSLVYYVQHDVIMSQQPPTEITLCDALLNQEQSFDRAIKSGSLLSTWGSLLSIVGSFSGNQVIEGSAIALIAATLSLVVVTSLIESRCGLTPGKWLMKLQVTRSTLRRTSFARSLVRTALLCIDLPLLLTPIPAVISMLFSRENQRIGDRIADTIVIRGRPQPEQTR